MFSRYLNVVQILNLIGLRYVLLYIGLFISTLYIPFSKQFTYLSVFETSKLPYLAGIWANFDGEHYLRIAREGYSGASWAFFPLYPIMLRQIHELTGVSIFIIGLILGQIFFIAGLLVTLYVLKTVYKVKNILLMGAFFLAYPTSFFYSAIYTEALFLLLLSLTLLFFHRKSYLFFIISAGMLALTRIQGVFVFILLFYILYSLKKSFAENFSNFDKRYLLLGVPIISLLLYMGYLFSATGDPLRFLTVQSSFGAQRSSSIILLPQVYVRYVRIFITASLNYQYLISLLEFLFFNFCFVLTLIHGYMSFKKKNSAEFGLALFSLANLILPTLTGTLSSIPRYSLFVWSPYFMLIALPSTSQRVIIGIFIVLQCMLFGFFAQGYFVG